MEQNSETEDIEIERIVGDDLRRAQDRNEDMKAKKAKGRSLWHSIIITGVGVLILIIVFVVFFKAHRKTVTVDLNTVKLSLKMLEGRLTHLEKQVPQFEESMSKLEQPEPLLTRRLDELSQKIDQLEKRIAPATTETEPPAGVPKALYHEVRSGETLYRIGKKYGLSVDQLRRLNNIDPNQTIKPGQKLLVSTKEPE